jgi:hypothetical protein
MKGNIRLLPLIRSTGSGYSLLRAADGEGYYRTGSVTGNQPASSTTIKTDSVAFAFRSGEIWSIETALLAYAKDKIYYTDLEKVFTESVQNYREFLKQLGIDPPLRWKAGLIGVRGRHLGYQPQPGYAWSGPGPICATDLIEAEGLIESNEQNTTTALLPFFGKIFEECGIVRPDYLPQ